MVVALFALFFAMAGGAYAAKHYLITSTKQISPKVMTALKGNRGPAGTAGPQGPQGPKGDSGTNGAVGATGPSASFQNTQDTPLTIPEPGGGVGTIDTLTLSGPASYLIQASGVITRTGLASGQGASHQVQLRQDFSVVGSATETITTVQGSNGSAATGAYSIVRLINVTGTTSTITITGYDQTAAGTTSTAKGALIATLVGSATGAG